MAGLIKSLNITDAILSGFTVYTYILPTCIGRKDYSQIILSFIPRPNVSKTLLSGVPIEAL